MRTSGRRLQWRRGAIAILAMTLIGVVLAVAGAVNAPRLVWNFTPSIPVGLYSIEGRDWRVEDRVALKPSGRLLEMLQATGVLKDGRLLMKRVAAAAGDKVCRVGNLVTINDVPRVVARPDAGLPAWSGCIVLQAAEVFLLGETPDSFDGRYFGASGANDIVGPLTAMMIL